MEMIDLMLSNYAVTIKATTIQESIGVCVESKN